MQVDHSPAGCAPLFVVFERRTHIVDANTPTDHWPDGAAGDELAQRGVHFGSGRRTEGIQTVVL